jgi:hypothetical protein
VPGITAGIFVSPRTIAICALIAAALLVAGCAGEIDFHDHSGIECPPASAANHCSGDVEN